jgi:hypothetical protein
MRLTTLSDKTLLVEQHLNASRQLLRESCDGLTLEQRRIVEGIYSELTPLIEASLSTDQIQQLFGQVEKSSTEAGGNRTLLGKAVDVPGKVDAAINKIGKYLQNTKPVQAFDQKFDQLKNKINTKFPDSKILDGISQLGIWAKENPGKTAAIIGVLTTLAGLAGGPVGGAIAGQILRGATELLKGEKLSTAIGKGIKTAAYGAMAGWLLDGIGDWLEGLRADVVPYDKMPGLKQINVGLTKSLEAPGMSLKQTVHSILVPEDSVAGFQAIVDNARGGDVNAFNDLLQFTERFSVKEYLADKAFTDAAARALAQQNDGFLQTLKTANDVIRSAAQGAVAGKLSADQVKVGGKPMTGTAGKTESYYVQTKPLSEGQVYLVFNRVQQLNEGPLDYIKKKAANLTTKVTADKLNSAWQKAGSPTDSNELAAFLNKQGVDSELVKQVYSQMKLPDPSATPNTDQETPQQSTALSLDQVQAMIAKLPTDRKVRLVNYMTKQLKVA